MQEQITRTEKDFDVRKKAMDAAMNAALAAMKAVSKQPDNPNINRVSSKPSIYKISSSKMDIVGLGLAPFTYDFIAQYQAMLDLLEVAPTRKTAAKRLDNIVNGNGNDREFGRFHPEAVANVKVEINEFLAVLN